MVITKNHQQIMCGDSLLVLDGIIIIGVIIINGYTHIYIYIYIHNSLCGLSPGLMCVGFQTRFTEPVSQALHGAIATLRQNRLALEGGARHGNE